MFLVWIDALTMSVNNPINILLISSNVVLFHVLFIKYLRISKKSLLSIGLKSTEKNFTILLILFFFIL